MLAEVSNAAADSQLGAWIRDLSICLGVLALIIKLFVRKPSVEAEFVTQTKHENDMNGLKSQIAEVRQKIESDTRFLVDKLDEVKTEIMVNGEHRTAGLHKRFDHVIEQRFPALEQRVARLEERTSGT